MRPPIRQQKILNLIRENERVYVEDLSIEFETSGETIRRDLNELAKQGLVSKFHGGAALLEAEQKESAFQNRLSENEQEKKLIARYTASLFQNGSNLFIDTGTTTLMFAKELAKQKKDLTVITNSTAIAHEIALYDHRVFLIGGEYHPESHQSFGPIAARQIKSFNAQHLVSTTGAISSEGIANYSLEEAEITKAMWQQAQYVTVIADHTKLDRKAIFQVSALNAIDRLITNQAPSEKLLSSITSASIDFHIAK